MAHLACEGADSLAADGVISPCEIRHRDGCVPDTWHQGKQGEEGMPRGTKGTRVRRACHVAPREVG